MKNTIITLLAIPLSCASLNAASIAFTWDAEAATGGLSTTITTGTGSVTLTGTLAAPTITHDDGGTNASSSYAAYQTDYTSSDGIPGIDRGTHFEWSGIVTIEGMDASGNTYCLDVDLTYEAGDSLGVNTSVVDESVLDATDVIHPSSGNRFALYLGERNSGHRFTDTQDTVFVAGDDTIALAHSATLNASHGSAIGDNLGFTYAFRGDYGSTVYLDDLQISGTLNQDEAGLVFKPVPEPSSTALLGLGGLALLFRRNKRS